MSTKTKGDILAERIEKLIRNYLPEGSRSEVAFLEAVQEYRKPWTLGRSVNGFTLGDGQEWHRNDWTEDMLPDGWRPLIKGEQVQDADQRFHSEDGLQTFPIKTEYGRMAEYIVAGLEHMHLRTRRPLPTVAKLVPLGPEDVPPWSVVRYCNHNSDIGNRWILVTAVSVNGICVMVSSGAGRIDYATMKEKLEISSDNGKTWQKCQKEAK